MCYNISQIDPPKLRRQWITQSTYYRNTLWQLIFSKKLYSGNILYIISFSGSAPYTSRDYSQGLPALFVDGVKRSNFILFTPSDVTVQKLAPPYDTACVDMSVEQMSDCYFECIMSALSPYNRIPTWEMIREDQDVDLNVRPLSHQDGQNMTFRNMVRHMQMKCGTCKRVACRSSYSQTTSRAAKATNISLAISNTASTEPDANIQVIPTMHFIDFFTYICSCFGTWFGLSCMSLMSLVNVVKRKWFRMKRESRLSRQQVIDRLQSRGCRPQAFM